MNVRFKTQGKSDILEIDGARIIFRNFSGAPTQFNAEGNRNFSLLIDDEELANELSDRGWNVKIKPPREEGEPPFMHLPVKVKFNEHGPKVYLKTGDKINMLNENTVGILDNIDIVNVDLDLRAYDWTMMNGTSGRSAYLQLIHVEQEVDRFASRYDFEPVDKEEIF